MWTSWAGPVSDSLPSAYGIPPTGRTGLGTDDLHFSRAGAGNPSTVRRASSGHRRPGRFKARRLQPVRRLGGACETRRVPDRRAVQTGAEVSRAEGRLWTGLSARRVVFACGTGRREVQQEVDREVGMSRSTRERRRKLTFRCGPRLHVRARAVPEFEVVSRAGVPVCSWCRDPRRWFRRAPATTGSGTTRREAAWRASVACAWRVRSTAAL